MRLVIVNADDLGYDPGIDRGILRAAREGVVTSTTLMVNTPFAADAVRAAAARPSLGLGLHLNFARGPALAGGALDEGLAPRLTVEAALAEARAQLQRFSDLVGRAPTHLDAHKHLHRHPAIQDAVVQLALEHGLPVRSIGAAMRTRFRKAGVPTPDAFIGDTGEQAYWTPAKVVAAFDRAEEGVTELMCHPGEAVEQVATSYGRQRLDELAALLDPAVREHATRGPFQLATYKVLAPKIA